MYVCVTLLERNQFCKYNYIDDVGREWVGKERECVCVCERERERESKRQIER